MSLSATIFFTGIVLFVLYLVVVQIEQKNARRLAGGRLRGWLDERVVVSERRIATSWNHFTRYIVKLGWYYGIHSLLRTILKVLVSVYTYIETIFERNRTRTKQLRSEFKKQIQHSHFAQIAHHKEKTALSPEAQKQLKKDKLEKDH